MAVRSRRLWGPTAIPATGGGITVLTVPADRTAIIRTIWLVNTHATETTNVSISVNGNTAADRILRRVAFPADSSERIETFLVLNPGDTLQMIRSGTGGMVAIGTGSLLLGAPS